MILSKRPSNLLYESMLPAYTPMTELTLEHPENIAFSNLKPYESFVPAYYYHKSLVKFLDNKDLVPGGNTGNPVRASELLRFPLTPHYMSGP